MQSKKRFKETFLWDADWYMNLTASEKLFWSYLNDHCDNIGVWEPNLKLAEFHVGSEIIIEQFFNRVNKGKKRLIKRSDNSWFLTGFVKFQYAQSKPLNPKSPAHKSYLDLMKERNLWNWFIENQPEVMPESARIIEVSKNSNRGLKELSERDKDTDKKKEKEKDKEVADFFNKAVSIINTYPKKVDPSDLSIIARVEDTLKALDDSDVKNPVEYLKNEIGRLDRRTAPDPHSFFESIRDGQELQF